MNMIITWAAGLIIGSIATSVLPKFWNNFMVKLRRDAKAKARQLIKDPEWRAIANQIIAKVQKEASSASSIKKLRLAVDYLKKIIPTNLDDAILEEVFNLLVAEIKVPFDL